MPIKGVRVGLIGAGRWGSVHRNALQRCGAELSAVLVRSEESASRLAKEWQVPVETSLERFLEHDCEAVIVASPNYLHAEHAVAALRAGRHVLVEKPMALDLPGCDAVLLAAAESGRLLAVGHEMRGFGLFEAVRRVILAGDIGRPVHLRLDLWRRPYRSGAGGWKQDPAKLGSTILEEPIHYLDLARWYLGEPRELQAWANSRSGREGAWENLEVRLELPAARAWVTRSIAAYGHQVTLQLVGEEGALRALWQGKMDMDPEPLVSLVKHAHGVTEAVPVTRRSGHAYDVPRQTRAFLEAAAGTGEPLADGQDGRAAVALCLAVQRSLLERGAAVAVEGSEVAR